MSTSETRYQHFCESCRFLGQFNEHDLFYCTANGVPLLVARYGDEEQEYTADPADVNIPELIEARSRAIDAGFLNELNQMVITISAPEFRIQINPELNTISSNLHETALDEGDQESCAMYNAAIDALESFVLAAYCEGVNIRDAGFIRALSMAVQSCAHQFS